MQSCYPLALLRSDSVVESRKWCNSLTNHSSENPNVLVPPLQYQSEMSEASAQQPDEPGPEQHYITGRPTQPPPAAGGHNPASSREPWRNRLRGSCGRHPSCANLRPGHGVQRFASHESCRGGGGQRERWTALPRPGASGQLFLRHGLQTVFN